MAKKSPTKEEVVEEVVVGEPIIPRCLVHITAVGGRAFGQLSDGTWGVIRVDESRDPIKLRFCPAVLEGVE